MSKSKKKVKISQKVYRILTGKHIKTIFQTIDIKIKRIYLTKPKTIRIRIT